MNFFTSVPKSPTELLDEQAYSLPGLVVDSNFVTALVLCQISLSARLPRAFCSAATSVETLFNMSSAVRIRKRKLRDL